MTLPLSHVTCCPYLVDFNNETKNREQAQPQNKDSSAGGSAASGSATHQQVNLASALDQFIQRKMWREYEPTNASVADREEENEQPQQM